MNERDSTIELHSNNGTDWEYSPGAEYVFGGCTYATETEIRTQGMTKAYLTKYIQC